MDPVTFSLSHSDQMSDEQYSVYTILIFPEGEGAKPQTVAVIPVDRETLEVNILSIRGEVMPTGVHAEVTMNEETQEEGIAPESISEAIIPRIFILLSMTITGYNFLDKHAQAFSELEEREGVPTDNLPKAPTFEFNTPEEFFKSLGDE